MLLFKQFFMLYTFVSVVFNYPFCTAKDFHYLYLQLKISMPNQIKDFWYYIIKMMLRIENITKHFLSFRIKQTTLKNFISWAGTMEPSVHQCTSYCNCQYCSTDFKILLSRSHKCTMIPFRTQTITCELLLNNFKPHSYPNCFY